MGLTKVHHDNRAFAHFLVHRHLQTLVKSHAQAQRQINAQDLVSEPPQHIERTGWFDLRQLDQHQQSACAPHQRAHCAAVDFTRDEVAFQVAQELTVFNLRRAYVDADHVGNLSPAILPLAARHALVVRLAQRFDPITLELAHGMRVDAVVDGFE
jgi:hypothetical protein